MILQADIILSNVNDGKSGEDGKSGMSLFKSYAFKRTDSDISGQQPTGGTWDNPVPTGWSDGIPAGTETLWQTVATFTKDADGKTSNTAWTKPAMVANTSDLLIFYSDSTTKPSAPTSNIADGTTWKETATENTIWMAQRVKKDGTWQNWTVIRVKGENGADGTSVKIKGTCLGHYTTNSAFQSALTSLKSGVYLIDENTQASRVSFAGGKNTSVGVAVEIGDGYLMSSSDTNLDGHLWMATDNGWQDCGKIKGDDGKDGQNGKNAVHYELRDNGSLADITIEDDKIKLTASLNYDLYRVDGTTETKVTGTVMNDLDGGALSYSDAHYTKTISKEYTTIDSLPASVITTAKVNNTVVATAVCKVSMSKTAYFNVDTELGKVTSMATDNENHIAALQLEATRISAKVGSMANPNLLLNSGFTIKANGFPDKWERVDTENSTVTFSGNSDNICTVRVNKTATYIGIKQTRKMQVYPTTKMTFSCLIQGSSYGNTATVYLQKKTGTAAVEGKSQKLTSDWARLTYTFTIDNYIDSWGLFIVFHRPAVGDWMSFRSPKLEFGETDTAYCEAENDRVLATGIDIEERKVTLTADTTLVRSNDGTQIALFGMASKGVPFLNTGLINAETITVNRLLAYNGDTMLTSINKEGNGEFIQYYPDGKKKMEIADGRIIYYNDDAKNSQKWVIGENGTAQSIDNWTVFQLCKTDPNGSNVRTESTLNGDTYSKFHAGENSVNKSYEGLTVFGRQNGTSPTNSGLIKIADGWYTNTAAAFLKMNENSSGAAIGLVTASRIIYEYKNGYKTGNMKTIEWLA